MGWFNPVMILYMIINEKANFIFCHKNVIIDVILFCDFQEALIDGGIGADCGIYKNQLQGLAENIYEAKVKGVKLLSTTFTRKKSHDVVM